MSGYRNEWPCCEDETYTEGWEPERCPFCELWEIKEKLEQAEARVAELEDLAVEAAQLFNAIKDGEYTADSFTAQPYERVQLTLSSQPWLLRKQAEAVEIATKACEIKSATDDRKCYSDALSEQAQHLRQQADEAGKAGGEQ